ncbi:MAG: diacylglycerol kinase family lipid kinase [Bacillota bacterium]|nr:diacylglycerol kinase family lipid kinase [Bacillota bacterium]
MRHIFIINPHAGKGITVGRISKIKEICSENGVEPEIEITKAPGHATEIARRYASDEDIRIYAVGGDGTLNEVLNGMVGSSSSLAVIPTGSGNDFIRSLCAEVSWEDILSKSIRGEAVPMDLGKAHDKYFINISSVGLDAEINYNSTRLKKLPLLPAKFAYLISIFLTVFGYKSKKMRIVLDDREIITETLLAAVANGRYYGGGMKVAPYAELWDGSFDICHVDRVGTFKIIRLFPRLMKGEHESIREVHFYRSKKVRIICEDEISVNIDGEAFRRKEIEFEVLPRCINIVVPI